MEAEQSTLIEPVKTKPDLMSFSDIEREGNGYPKKSTLWVWKSVNRHGFREIVIMVGGRPRVRRRDWESWLEGRKLTENRAAA